MGLTKWFYLFAVCCFFLVPSCRTHSHDYHHHHDHDDDHDHDSHEAPAFKYSRAANEKVVHHDHKHAHEDHNKYEKPKEVPNTDIWLYALGSTLFISAAPVVILFVVPLDNTEQKQPLLKILLAFASGGLLGDAFLHLIPHATMSTDAGHGHSHAHGHEEEHVHDMSVGLGVLSGILVFLVIEKGVRFIKGGHSHSHAKKDAKQVDKKVKNSKTEDKPSNPDKAGDSKPASTKEKASNPKHASPSKDIKVAGYLNLAADFSHNFTDGLAIGASYLAGNNVGLITTVTILLHEVPHEIGDFAILLQSGVSRKNAMLLQLTTAIGALAGTALSLSAQDGYGLLAANWILPFTAGGFIYIALVSVIPELLEEEKPSLIQTMLQLTAMIGGIYMMVRIAEFE